jgi:aminopeptidase N
MPKRRDKKSIIFTLINSTFTKMITRLAIFTTAALSLLASSIFAQRAIPRLAQLDVQHYRYELELSDQTDEIKGKATIRIRLLQPLDSFALDLVKPAAPRGKGMNVSIVAESGQKASYRHAGNQLWLYPQWPVKPGEEREYEIRYAGIPADGLIIDKNKHGDRTFFGDNWPNRAHHWLPCVDHPSDKASVEFIVTAPDHYQVVANGLQIEKTNLNDETTLTHWREEVPLPTKVMVIGAARFGVQHAGEVQGIPISSWVYRQDRQPGFYDYQQAVEVLEFFIDHLGPYPYKKLANVQSKTRYGGMENASSIFYFEGSVTGQREHEDLIAHEIAHQWFGNSASEQNWHHIWLSEGFANYGTNLYFEHKYGREKMVERLLEEKEQVLEFYRRNPAPVVDTSVTDWNRLLNPNSYQKGGWVLHMLRRQVGDDAFWQGLRHYYRIFEGRNALTEDFQRVMELTSGQDLSAFFQQWLYWPGQPILLAEWSYGNGSIELTLEQLQDGPAFTMPVEIEARDRRGQTQRWIIQTDGRPLQTQLTCPFQPHELILDPDTWLLFSGSVLQKQ